MGLAWPATLNLHDHTVQIGLAAQFIEWCEVLRQRSRLNDQPMPLRGGVQSGVADDTDCREIGPHVEAGSHA
jgi:hypothetical protein